MTEKHKVCFKCGESKPLSAFYKHPKMLDGHVNKCKDCNRHDVRENRGVKKDYYRDYDKIRTVKGSERYISQLEYAAKYRSLNKRKRSAQSKLRQAILKGLIKRPDCCEYCGIQCKPDAHHSSYSPEMSLVVTWLCPGCHHQLHRDFERTLTN